MYCFEHCFFNAKRVAAMEVHTCISRSYLLCVTDERNDTREDAGYIGNLFILLSSTYYIYLGSRVGHCLYKAEKIGIINNY